MFKCFFKKKEKEEVEVVEQVVEILPEKISTENLQKHLPKNWKLEIEQGRHRLYVEIPSHGLTKIIFETSYREIPPNWQIDLDDETKLAINSVILKSKKSAEMEFQDKISKLKELAMKEPNT
jgi:hypothetical protein